MPNRWAGASADADPDRKAASTYRPTRSNRPLRPARDVKNARLLYQKERLETETS
jgi:hypothetical protein